nr:class I SAM-dependent methyltransferase [Motilibacter aurantiacus]
MAPLGLRPGKRVVDVGCGTGELPERVARAVVPEGAPAGSGEVVGVEPDPSLYAVASARSRPGLRFVPARAQELASAVGDSGAFDAVLSVAALHWVDGADHPLVLSQMAAVLRPEGLLRLDFGGAGQIERPREVLDAVAREHGLAGAGWYFPEAADYGVLLAAAGFSLVDGWARLVRQRRPFADADALRLWLRSQVLPAYLAGVDDAAAAAFSAEAEERCVQELRREDGSYDQDYVRLDVLARRR